ncbi:MAG: MBL fold metallo-hydrolase [Bdellovibrionota bacterium]
MATPSLRRQENVPGPFFVDGTCIDCDACRWIAPEVFDEAGDKSRVHRQPESPEAKRKALRALVSCPTASIGTSEKEGLEEIASDFPLLVDGNVYHCGYHHKDSFGATSYLILRSGGNVLVDTPRFTMPLVRRLEAMGGFKWLFLTHSDDVADHEKFAKHFGCRRIIHEGDQSFETRGAEQVVKLETPVTLAEDLLAIPVPGHTRGSMCLLHKNYLFTGDHLAWSDRQKQLVAFRNACWYSWGELTRSMKKLSAYSFEWVLPGHGRRCFFPSGRMREELSQCIRWMEGA